MGSIRVLLEGFLRGRERSWYKGHRAFRVLALAMLVGATLVVGWLLLGPLLVIPRFTLEGTVVRNGVAVVVVCGEKQREVDQGLWDVGKVAPEPQTGGWWPSEARRGECTVWYHRPPDASQREARQERAQ